MSIYKFICQKKKIEKSKFIWYPGLLCVIFSYLIIAFRSIYKLRIPNECIKNKSFCMLILINYNNLSTKHYVQEFTPNRISDVYQIMKS